MDSLTCRYMTQNNTTVFGNVLFLNVAVYTNTRTPKWLSNYMNFIKLVSNHRQMNV